LRNAGPASKRFRLPKAGTESRPSSRTGSPDRPGEQARRSISGSTVDPDARLRRRKSDPDRAPGPIDRRLRSELSRNGLGRGGSGRFPARAGRARLQPRGCGRRRDGRRRRRTRRRGLRRRGRRRGKRDRFERNPHRGPGSNRFPLLGCWFEAPAADGSHCCLG
jgi:hypothetical protein